MALTQRDGFRKTLGPFYDELETRVTMLDETNSVYDFSQTVRVIADNSTSFRLRGNVHADDVAKAGAAVAQNYCGIFYNDAYDTIGSRNTRATFAANTGMDAVIQGPHAVGLFASGGETDGHAFVYTSGNIKLHARGSGEDDSVVAVVVDRVDTGTQGSSNTSDVVIKADGGGLHVGADAGDYVTLDNVVGLKAHTTDELEALTGMAAGAAAYCSDGASGSPCLAVYNGSNWLQVALGSAIDDGA